MSTPVREILRKNYKRKQFKRRLISILYPERCPYCDCTIEPLKIACEDCLKKICRPYYSRYAFGGYSCVSALPYSAPFDKALKTFKFGTCAQYSPQFAEILAQAIKSKYTLDNIDLITCVPLHKNRLKSRGFNQSELLCQDLSLILGIPYENLLTKIKDNPPQHQQLGENRQKNVAGVYRIIDKKAVIGKRILLIDDIITTGHTLGECARILKNGKASEILCATFTYAVFKTEKST